MRWHGAWHCPRAYLSLEPRVRPNSRRGLHTRGGSWSAFPPWKSHVSLAQNCDFVTATTNSPAIARSVSWSQMVPFIFQPNLGGRTVPETVVGDVLYRVYVV